MTAESNPSTASSLSLALSVKLSPFCPGEATSWFRRAEIQFRLRKVTDPRTKADYVLEAIPEHLFPRVAAWLDNQDQSRDIDYESLKSYLLQEFTLTVSALAQRLLSLPQLPLGDTTAHAAWNEMQALAMLPDLDPETKKPRQVDLFRELWLQRLPPNVRSALHEADDSPMDDLIKKADNLINAARASGKPTRSTPPPLKNFLTSMLPSPQSSSGRPTVSHENTTLTTTLRNYQHTDFVTTISSSEQVLASASPGASGQKTCSAATVSHDGGLNATRTA